MQSFLSFVRLALIIPLLALVAFFAIGSSTTAHAWTQPMSSGAIAYTHRATTTNSTENWTDLSDPVTSNNPNALVFVTANWSPQGVYDTHPLGVWYHNGHWAIFHQDLTAIPVDAAYNVLAFPTAQSNVFTHIASASNSFGNYTDLQSSDPNATLLVTANWSPQGVYDTHPLGVWYHNGHWAIFHQDLAPMPASTAFNVAVLTGGDVSEGFVHTATTTNIEGNWTDLSDTVTCNNPSAIVFVTANWAPQGVYDPHQLGVWYHDGHWAIFHQDQTAIPVNAAYNVLAFPSSTQSQ